MAHVYQAKVFSGMTHCPTSGDYRPWKSMHITTKVYVSSLNLSRRAVWWWDREQPELWCPICILPRVLDRGSLPTDSIWSIRYM